MAGMTQGLVQRQAMVQKLVMTQQLKQAIQLLQLSQIELVASIEAELQENPTLEEIPGTEAHSLSDAEMRLEDQARKTHEEASEQANGSGEDGIDWQKFLAEQSEQSFATGASAGNYDDLPPIETTLSTSVDLTEHLLSQLAVQSCTDGERAAATVIIMNLNERGWLEVDLDYVAEESDADMDDVEGALMIVQGLDPLGCGARDLAECLIIQVKQRWPEDPFFPDLIQDHLSDIEGRNYAAIARAMDMDEEDVIEYHKMLQECEPWPARPFMEAEDQYITPDIEVRKIGGEWQVIQNEDGLPKLRISPHYHQMISGNVSKDDKSFVEERLKAAKFLIESIYKRQNTIQRVMKAILDRQREFFDRGPEALKPMILRDVADDIEVHESTVSRATSNKYVLCPHGIFELKYFFNAGIKKTTGGELGAEAVKEKIRKILADEDKNNPLSDSDVADRLKTQHNIKIARRTIAKYREAMGILPSSQRKKVF